jgi:hypothetical protein
MNAGGFQFDPANAARFLMEGGKLGLDSENAALAALLYPFGNRAGTNPGGGPNNPNGGPNGLPSQRPNGGGGGGGGGFNFSNPLQIAQIARQFGVDPGALFRILGQGSTFGIDPQTIANFQQSGLAQTLGWDPMNPQGWNLQNINPAGSLLDVPGLWGPPPGGGLSTGIDDVASLPWWLGGDGGGEVPETFWDDLDWGAWWGDWGD